LANKQKDKEPETAENEVPADLLARIATEVPIKSPYPRSEDLDGTAAAKAARREVGDVAEEFPEVEGGLLERETGLEPATLSLGSRQNRPKGA
jgi:hypothetical protein